MIEFRYRQILIIFSFSFFATMALLSLMSDNRLAVWGMLTCLWHELGHFAAMKICGVKITKVVFYGAGIKIVPDKSFDFAPAMRQLFVYVAGSAANLITAAVLASVGEESVKQIAIINSIVGIFNLLPLQYLDGGKILILAIHTLCNFQHAILLERFLKWLNVILIMLVLIAFAVMGAGNITLYVTLSYLLISALSC